MTDAHFWMGATAVLLLVNIFLFGVLASAVRAYLRAKRDAR